MKKIVYLILGIIIIFLISNFNVFFANFYINNGNDLYKNGNFSGALLNYNKSLEYLENNISLHNIGNTYFKFGTGKYLESLNSYSGALKIKFDKDTKYNYDFVESLLEQEQQEQQTSPQPSPFPSMGQVQEREQDQSLELETGTGAQSEQNNNKTGTGSQEKQTEENIDNNNESNEKDSDGKKEQTSSQNSNQVDKNNGTEPNNFDEMSNGEYQQVKKYIENLEKNQEEYQDYFNKSPNNINDPFDMFGESMFDSFFDDGGEKDW